MPIKEPPVQETTTTQAPTVSEKNPHIDVRRPSSVRCFPKKKEGAVTFDNGGSENVVVTVTPTTLFGCAKVPVNKKSSVTKRVLLEECKGTYRVGTAALTEATSTSRETLQAAQAKAYSEPKDIIVP